jgi:predicted Fe-Mo cluster-binding NifX family protein
MAKIVVSATGKTLEAEVEPRFGRTPYFVLIDPETLEYEAVANRQNLEAAQGAGIQAASLVAQYHPEALLTGYCGPKAYHVLLAAGIPVFLHVSGLVGEVVEQYRQGNLTVSRGPNARGHW